MKNKPRYTICYNCGDRKRIDKKDITSSLKKGIGKCKNCGKAAVALSEGV